jgi:hypothetical protein
VDPVGALGFLGAISPVIAIVSIPLLGALWPSVPRSIYDGRLIAVRIRLLDDQQSPYAWSTITFDLGPGSQLFWTHA